MPLLFGLSALYDQETAEFTDLSKYQKCSSLCAHSIGHPKFHTQKQEILMIFGHFDPQMGPYIDG